MRSETSSCFHRIFDVVVYGSGYAAYAAALQLHQAGRHVLLVNRLADLLWESGRSFAMESGTLDAPAWQTLMEELRRRNALAADGRIDGAIAEVIATAQVRDAKLPILYYVAPLAVQMAGKALEAVVFGTKSGLQRLVARQWIDASETGELLKLIDPNHPLRRPESLQWRAFYQHHHWSDTQDRDLSPSAGAQALTWQGGIWSGERCLILTLPGDTPRPRQAIIPALEALRQAAGPAMTGSVLSHCTLDPLPVYGQADTPTAPVPATNLACAAPAGVDKPIRTLADRFALGLAAAAALAQRAVHECDPSLLHAPIEASAIQPAQVIQSDVVVAGAGTGGAMAAIAAGRAGVRVTCIDPLSFVGGIGAGGGIHWYYFGVAGGLQEEMDQRVLKLMELFGTKAQVIGFHPDAKKLVLEQMLEEAGVRLIPHTMLCGVQTTGRRIVSALAANANGPIELRAGAWIDATGDGDLCALAGASFTFGRDGDGGLHAYSQSSGRMTQNDKGMRMAVVNYDAGWVDPTDSQDLTRGRLVGITQYLPDASTPAYSAANRPTYIAPAIGLRQARHITTDYTLSLADLIERSQFSDAIGFTGAHFDNHAVDYEFESDEAAFWVWVCRAWRGHTACQMPYRMIVPRDLDNVWIACRAFGVSPDAHHSCRMQRDMQRAGEAAGLAAALAAKLHTDARGVPMDQLQKALAETGAVDLRTIDIDHDLGPIAGSRAFDNPAAEPLLRAGLEHLRAGQPSDKIWHVYRAGQSVRDQVIQCLASDNPAVSWLAAGILAAWGDHRAEPRLLQAIATREYGFDNDPDAQRPEHFPRVLPHWLVAVTLLRMCGSSACLPALHALAHEPALALNVRTAIALTLERLAKRGVELDADQAQATPAALTADPIPGSFVIPQRLVMQSLQGDPAPSTNPTAEDHRWQLHLVIARARLALGLPPHPAAEEYRHDPRLTVRRAFAQLPQPAPIPAAAPAS